MKRILATAAVAAVMSTAYAGGTETYTESMTNNIQYGVSLMYDEVVDDMGVGFDLQNQMFEGGVNLSVDHNNTNAGVSFTEWYLGAYAGMRKAFRPDVFGSLGVMGNYGFLSGNWETAGLTKKPYTVGAYVGLAYQPKEYLKAFVRVMPYSYERNAVNLKENEFFQEGQVGLTYFFSV